MKREDLKGVWKFVNDAIVFSFVMALETLRGMWDDRFFYQGKPSHTGGKSTLLEGNFAQLAGK